MQARKGSLQPILVVTGSDWKTIDEVYVCINDIRWKVDDIVRGFDMLFKTFYILDTSLPKESELLWGIIQRWIYKMNASPTHSNVASIIVDLNEYSRNQLAQTTQQIQPQQTQQQTAPTTQQTQQQTPPATQQTQQQTPPPTVNDLEAESNQEPQDIHHPMSPTVPTEDPEPTQVSKNTNERTDIRKNL